MAKHTIKWTDVMRNLHFVHNRDGHVSLVLFNGTPMSMSNMDHRRAEEIKIELSNCNSADEMVLVMKRFGQHKVEAITPPPAPVAATTLEIDAAQLLWSLEGGSSVTLLIETLKLGRGLHHTSGVVNMAEDEITLLCEKASDLSPPSVDWESAAAEEGWHEDPEGGFTNNSAGIHEECDNWQDLCEGHGIAPHISEIRDHFIVSEWLALELESLGEKVDTNFAGMAVWAKTGDAPVLEHPMILTIAEAYDPEYENGEVAALRP